MKTWDKQSVNQAWQGMKKRFRVRGNVKATQLISKIKFPSVNVKKYGLIQKLTQINKKFITIYFLCLFLGAISIILVIYFISQPPKQLTTKFGFAISKNNIIYIERNTGKLIFSGHYGNENNEVPISSDVMPKWHIISSLGKITHVAAYAEHFLAVNDEGELWVKGDNKKGQLGLKKELHNNTWQKIENIPEVLSVATNENHSLFVTRKGDLYGVGYNGQGQLGVKGGKNRYEFQQISIDTKLKTVANGAYHSVALSRHGTLWVTGLNMYGELGLGTKFSSNDEWTEVEHLKKIIKVDAGDGHTLALSKKGVLWVTGRNDIGQLGFGDKKNRYEWEKAAIDGKVIDMSAGAFHTIALTEDGSVWATGVNIEGQLGIGSFIDKTSWIKVEDIDPVVSVKAGFSNSIGLTSDNVIVAAGLNDRLQLGDLNFYYTLYWSEIDFGE